MSTTAQGRVEEYLDRLEAELVDLPSARRRELVDEIASHIVQARAELGDDPGEAETLTLLDRIGDPAEIAAEARERFGVTQPPPPAPQRQPDRGIGLEIAAILLLLFGGFLAGVGWLVGVVLLWLSERWSTRDKILATLLVPGGLAALLFIPAVGLGGAEICFSTNEGPVTCGGGGFSTAGTVFFLTLAVVCLVGPLLTAWNLARRLSRPPPQSTGRRTSGNVVAAVATALIVAWFVSSTLLLTGMADSGSAEVLPPDSPAPGRSPP